jgi:hypothetical protein
MIRTYAFEQQNYITALQASYTGIIAQHRAEIGQVQRTHHEWQASLGRLGEGLRASLRAREEEGRPWKRRIAGLKAENTLLRRKVGWEPVADSDSEDDEEMEEEGRNVGAGPRARQQAGVEERRALLGQREDVLMGLREGREGVRRDGALVGQG